MRRHVLLLRLNKKCQEIVEKRIKFGPFVLGDELLFDKVTKRATLVLGIGVEPDEIETELAGEDLLHPARCKREFQHAIQAFGRGQDGLPFAYAVDNFHHFSNTNLVVFGGQLLKSCNNVWLSRFNIEISSIWWIYSRKQECFKTDIIWW